MNEEDETSDTSSAASSYSLVSSPEEEEDEELKALLLEETKLKLEDEELSAIGKKFILHSLLAFLFDFLLDCFLHFSRSSFLSSLIPPSLPLFLFPIILLFGPSFLPSFFHFLSPLILFSLLLS